MSGIMGCLHDPAFIQLAGSDEWVVTTDLNINDIGDRHIGKPI